MVVVAPEDLAAAQGEAQAAVQATKRDVAKARSSAGLLTKGTWSVDWLPLEAKRRPDDVSTTAPNFAARLQKDVEIFDWSRD